MTSKTALVTGASTGIGRATCIALSQAGFQIIALARREDKLRALETELSTAAHIIACDINDHDALSQALDDRPREFQNIDVLVNNAGLALGLESADKTDWRDWQTMIETNCLSLAFMTRQIVPQMVERNVGHVINIGSIAGSYAYKGGNVYGASKAFVEQFSKGLRTDFLGSNLRVTNIEPGLLGNTEFSLVRFHGDQSAADEFYKGCQPLNPEDVAESVRWVVELPKHVNINQLEMMPVCQAPAGLAVDKQP